MKKGDIKWAVLRIEGTNSEDESAQCMRDVGVQAEIVHLKQLTGDDVTKAERRKLSDYDGLWIAGGFSPQALGARRHLKRLKADMRAVRQVYVALAEDARGGDSPPPAAEWLLDNYFVVSAAARDVRHDLPVPFFGKLPIVAADEFAGHPRIYALASELIRCSAARLDAQRLLRFVNAFQSIAPLTIGELWAWPSAPARCAAPT